jgi:putative PIN family toxin of toxin-antitoxin system
MEILRIVVDTNIWISFLIGQTLSGLANQISQDRVMVLFSKELFQELIAVLHRPKFQRYFTAEDIRE